MEPAGQKCTSLSFQVVLGKFNDELDRKDLPRMTLDQVAALKSVFDWTEAQENAGASSSSKSNDPITIESAFSAVAHHLGFKVYPQKYACPDCVTHKKEITNLTARLNELNEVHTGAAEGGTAEEVGVCADGGNNDREGPESTEPGLKAAVLSLPIVPRRSQRVAMKNTKYFNDDVVSQKPVKRSRTNIPIVIPDGVASPSTKSPILPRKTKNWHQRKGKVIGRNDIFVNTRLGKIQLESDVKVKVENVEPSEDDPVAAPPVPRRRTNREVVVKQEKD